MSHPTLMSADCSVLVLGRRTAALMCGTLLADLGASVVVAEPTAAAVGERAVTVVGTRSVVADGPDELTELIERADVLVLSSDLDRRQLGAWERPRPVAQVICDVTGFGHTGPLAGVAMTAGQLQAMSGAADTTGNRGGAPVLSDAPYLEMQTAVYAASAILAALRVVRVTGQGQRIDMAVFDVGVNALATYLPLALAGLPATRNGNRHPSASPWNSYATRDGALVICAPTDAQWARLCAAMERSELATRAHFATTTARLTHADELDAEISLWTRELTTAACEQTLRAAVVPAGAVVSVDQLAVEPNIAHRGSILTVEDPDTERTVDVLPSPVRLAGQTRRATSIPARGAESLATLRSQFRDPVRPDRVVGDPRLRLLPLAGVRVIEIGMNTVAPLACRQLGALGADVIKVEPPAGDTNRTNPPLRGRDGSYFYALSNTDKRGVVLDLRSESEQASLWHLIASADVLVENLKPGSLDRLGFGAIAVRERRPDLVYCSINGFGHDSAYPERPALDTVIQAMSGLMSATRADGVPTKTGSSFSDQIGGQFGLLAVLGALDRRERTGEGATLDLADARLHRVGHAGVVERRRPAARHPGCGGRRLGCERPDSSPGRRAGNVARTTRSGRPRRHCARAVPGRGAGPSADPGPRSGHDAA